MHQTSIEIAFDIFEVANNDDEALLQRI
ncbi:YccJ family protein [Sodalis-like endosymbiont of Proechinophthirus fluctus]